jgi:hypothetical protein
MSGCGARTAIFILIGGRLSCGNRARAPLEKPIDWLSGWKASFERIRQRFGMPVAVLLALSVAGGLVWWNWDDIAKRPGINRACASRLKRDSIRRSSLGGVNREIVLADVLLKQVRRKAVPRRGLARSDRRVFQAGPETI